MRDVKSRIGSTGMNVKYLGGLVTTSAIHLIATTPVRMFNFGNTCALKQKAPISLL